jgi:hypothetical protein
MKRKNQNRKSKNGYGYLSFIDNVSPHRHHRQRFIVHYY